MMKFEERKKHREAAFEAWQKIRMMMRRRFIIKRIMFSAIIIALLSTVMLTAAFNIGHGESVHSLTSPIEVSILSEAPLTQWNKTYGGTDRDRPSALVQTSDGGYAIAGSTYSYGAGLCDVWLIKTDAYGNIEWNKTHGGIYRDWDWALIQTSDGSFVIAGSTSSYRAESADVWLIKTDAYGNVKWSKTYGGPMYEGASALVKNSDGGYAIAGCTRSYGAGLCDVWLLKTDAYGNIEWNKTYGGPSSDWASALVKTSDGGFAIACSTSSYGAGSADAWLIKLVIPEFPLATILLVLMALITLTVAFAKKKLPRKPKT